MNISEISSDQYQQITPLLGEYSDYPVINAVIEGNAPGRIFVDRSNQPESAFVLTNAGFSYLVGSPHNEVYNQRLKGYLEREIFPEIRTSDDPTLIFYPLADQWEEPIRRILQGCKTHDLARKQFGFDQAEYTHLSDVHDRVQAGYILQPIDQVSLEKFSADMFPWQSPQDFLDKGFGFWLLTGDEIACECSSIFVGGGAAEINIHTEVRHRRQGLATIAATAFIAECLARGLRPNWECWWNNQPSISLAQKMGFKPINDHKVFMLELK